MRFACDSFNLRVMGVLVCNPTINQEPSVEETEVGGVWSMASCLLSALPVVFIELLCAS